MRVGGGRDGAGVGGYCLSCVAQIIGVIGIYMFVIALLPPLTHAASLCQTNALWDGRAGNPSHPVWERAEETKTITSPQESLTEKRLFHNRRIPG